MITFERIRETRTEAYRKSEKLLTATFPTDEYRAIEEQRKNVESNPAFHFNIIFANSTPIGLLSFWDFGSYIYIEHFATEPTVRNRGYGEQCIKQLIKKYGNIVLEVERPTDDTTRRRIAFYQRSGLTLCPNDYTQPAYRPDSREVPMQLMYCGIQLDKNFEKIKREIHREVYGIMK